MPLWVWIVVIALGVLLTLYRRWSERSALKRRERELQASAERRRTGQRPGGGS